MQSAKELEQKFEAYREAIEDQFVKIESKSISSEKGFKHINQLLIEIKTLVGKPQ
jgi:hypothetical protein